MLLSSLNWLESELSFETWNRLWVLATPRSAATIGSSREYRSEGEPQ